MLGAQTHLTAELVAAAVQHRHLQQRLAVVIEAAAGGVGKAQAEGAAGRFHHCGQRHFGSWSHFRLEAGEGSGQLAFSGPLLLEQGGWSSCALAMDRRWPCGGPPVSRWSCGGDG